MAISSESNFPNSRITAGLQAKDVDDPESLLFIEGVNNGGRNSLLVSTESSSGFVSEKFDKIVHTFTVTEDIYTYSYLGVEVCAIVATYTDATKTVLDFVERINP